MQKFTSLPAMAALVALMGCLATGAAAGERAPATVKLAGEKLDSGLGELPHYSQWADATGKTPMAKPAKPAGRDGDQSVQLSRLK